MSHDPYCPLRQHEVDHMDDYWCDDSCEVDCQCDMIALVREDERGKFVQVDPTYMPAKQYDAMMDALNDEEYYNDLLSENREMNHEVQVLRAVIQHMIDKHEVEEPKVNNIPVSEWKGEMSLRTFGGEE